MSLLWIKHGRHSCVAFESLLSTFAIHAFCVTGRLIVLIGFSLVQEEIARFMCKVTFNLFIMKRTLCNCYNFILLYIIWLLLSQEKDETDSGYRSGTIPDEKLPHKPSQATLNREELKARIAEFNKRLPGANFALVSTKG